MSAVHLVYAWPLFGAGLVSLALAVLASRRSGPGARSFALLMVASATWAFGDGLLHLSDTLGWQLFWTRVQYVGIAAAPVLWLQTALAYTRRASALSPWLRGTLWVVPVLTVLQVWTVESHTLFYREVDIRRPGTLLLLDLEYGPGWWLHMAYSYLVIGVGAVLFLDSAVRSFHAVRSQAVALLAGIAVPVAANILYVAEVGPFRFLDPTPLALAVAGLPLAWAILRLRLFDLAPLARATVIQGLADGVVVVDPHDRIADVNPAAVRVLGGPASRLVGMSLERLQETRGAALLPERRGRGASREVLLPVDGQERVFEVRVSPVLSPGGDLQGRALVLRDVTESRVLGRALRSAREEIRLLEGLLPICSWCRNVRNDDGEWQELERYVGKEGKATFTHGICPTCREELEGQVQAAGGD
jgi:PAS domain S-box-containing protein